jgi:hypothetical protein
MKRMLATSFNIDVLRAFNLENRFGLILRRTVNRNGRKRVGKPVSITIIF